MKAADEATKEVEAATQTSKSAAEKDKYKQLARRLKEERNNFRFVCVDFCTILPISPYYSKIFHWCKKVLKAKIFFNAKFQFLAVIFDLWYIWLYFNGLAVCLLYIVCGGITIAAPLYT